MTNDEWVAMQLDDLLDLIKSLEERIISLERRASAIRSQQRSSNELHEDAWYWEHG